MSNCIIRVEKLDSNLIKEAYEKAIKETLAIKRQITLNDMGEIHVSGEGFDQRCAFCEYYRKIIGTRLEERKTDGSIEFINCPFKLEKRYHFSEETIKKQKELLKKMKPKKEIFKD